MSYIRRTKEIPVENASDTSYSIITKLQLFGLPILKITTRMVPLSPTDTKIRKLTKENGNGWLKDTLSGTGEISEPPTLYPYDDFWPMPSDGLSLPTKQTDQ